MFTRRLRHAREPGNVSNGDWHRSLRVCGEFSLANSSSSLSLSLSRARAGSCLQLQWRAARAPKSRAGYSAEARTRRRGVVLHVLHGRSRHEHGSTAPDRGTSCSCRDSTSGATTGRSRLPQRGLKLQYTERSKLCPGWSDVASVTMTGANDPTTNGGCPAAPVVAVQTAVEDTTGSSFHTPPHIRPSCRGAAEPCWCSTVRAVEASLWRPCCPPARSTAAPSE